MLQVFLERATPLQKDLQHHRHLDGKTWSKLLIASQCSALRLALEDNKGAMLIHIGGRVIQYEHVQRRLKIHGVLHMIFAFPFVTNFVSGVFIRLSLF